MLIRGARIGRKRARAGTTARVRGRLRGSIVHVLRNSGDIRAGEYAYNVVPKPLRVALAQPLLPSRRCSLVQLKSIARFNRRAIEAGQARGFKSNDQTQVVADVAVNVNTKSASKSAEKCVRAGAASRRCAPRAQPAQGARCARSAVV